MATQLAVIIQGAGGNPSMMFVYLLPLLGLFAYMMWQQQRQKKKWQEMLTQVKPGDKVVTSGGLTGVVMSVKDDTLVLRVPPDNIKIEVTRASVVTLTTPEDKPKS